MVCKAFAVLTSLAVLPWQLGCSVLGELGPPTTAREGFVPAGTTPHQLRITLNPDPTSPEGQAASECVARCSTWSPSAAEHGRCVAACPSAVATWDARCRRNQAMCFDYVALRPLPKRSAQASGTAGEIAAGTIAFVGTAASIGLLDELCDRHSSDPNCNQDDPALGPPR